MVVADIFLIAIAVGAEAAEDTVAAEVVSKVSLRRRHGLSRTWYDMIPGAIHSSGFGALLTASSVHCKVVAAKNAVAPPLSHACRGQRSARTAGTDETEQPKILQYMTAPRPPVPIVSLPQRTDVAYGLLCLSDLECSIVHRRTASEIEA